MALTAALAPTAWQCSRLSRVKACWVKSGPVVQGRSSLRIPFSDLIVVTPWDEAARGPTGRSILADGRDISEEGVAFRHRQPLPYRYAVVSYRETDPQDGEPRAVESVLVRLLWCRFVRGGSYLSGGRFERPLEREFGEPFWPLLRKK
jgi:hypothetical protein